MRKHETGGIAPLPDTETIPGAEGSLELLRAMIIAPNILPGMSGDSDPEIFVADYSDDLDFVAAWAAYNACSGRVYRQHGDTLDHKTVSFEQWLAEEYAVKPVFPDEPDESMPVFDLTLTGDEDRKLAKL